ncbi:hypothetical protein F6V30_14030 [Oryzomonas sagensis]|uniref:DNA binding HTH domain-containing protein n=1 Tax=Oryzomonas sagensis TaxID=2603857 RepID=A0ABQ6TKY8_9BACT|nr:hypothetical protein [Oryzomonas sagensis]KAB0668952.1 hypothetical protein F6V30_14030 [Oryzomonas sagensis]
MAEPTEKTTRKKDPRKAPKHTPIKRIVAQLAAGNNKTQVAKNLNVSPNAVGQMLKRYGITDKHLESFKINRADIFAGLQETVAGSFSRADIKKASVRDRTILLGTLYDKERLERGQSTQNIAVRMASAVLESDED